MIKPDCMKPVSLDDVVYGVSRPCFNCEREILEAHLANGSIVTLNRDRTRHAFTCEKRSFQMRVEQGEVKA